MMTKYFSKNKLTKITLVMLLPFSFLAMAQANSTDGLSDQQTNDPNALDEDNFKLNLADYLGAEQFQEFEELSHNNQQSFYDNLTQILKAQGINTRVNNKQIDTLELMKPLMQAYVSTLRSVDYAGTEPQQHYQNLMQERNKLFTQSVYLPKEVESAFTSLKRTTDNTAIAIEKCDADGNGTIVGLHERNCAGKVILEEEIEEGKRLDQSIAEGIEEGKRLDQSIAEGIEEGKQLDQNIAELINDIRTNIEQ